MQYCLPQGAKAALGLSSEPAKSESAFATDVSDAARFGGTRMHPSCSALLFQACKALIYLGRFQTTGTKEMSNLSAEEMRTNDMFAL